MSPFNQTLLVEDVPVGQVALKRHPRIVFDSEREIMKVVDNEHDDLDDGDDDNDSGIPQPKPTGHLESPQMLLLPPPSPPPNPPPPPPPTKSSAAASGKALNATPAPICCLLSVP